MRVSPKHGLNPSLVNCYYCGEHKELALFGRLPGDQEAPREAVHDLEPCDTCVDLMSRGVLFISVRDGEIDRTNQARDKIPNPYRTGGWVVVREEAVSRIVAPDAAADLLRRRWAFIEDAVWDKIGLPRAPVSEAGG